MKRGRWWAWAVTGALLALILPARAGAETDLRTMLGQMLLVGFRGAEITEDAPIVRDIQAFHIGGVILFDRDVLSGGARNILSPAQVRTLTASLQAAASIPLFIGVDQEGGRVRRLREEHGFPALPSAWEMGQGTEAATRRWGERTGAMLADVGINLDFAPVVDVAVDPQSPAIGALGRSFAADPQAVARHALAFAQGLRSQGVLACLKHFPGHGSARTDSHLGITDVTATWSPAELIPYARILPTGVASCVMTGHLFVRSKDAAAPATLSAAIVTGMLRQELGFDGVVISDDLQMRAITDHFGLEEAAVRAVAAGVDMLLVGNNLQYAPDVVPRVVQALEAAVAAGRLSPQRIEASWRRIMHLKAELPAGGRGPEARTRLED
ncbi:beta-N-acetylhexosaminidase [Thermodesulfomicrobium sp. WS]|uniref:beta-N-acetylhexosaminidase n=1 Tax=Thermodesulfomicrobium sp. WS TaxID=3004129 RepID=UPI00249346E5|nr:beta-N-acetylhexosaminidase [Thermodesulfomicrobium sp. WS]